MTSTPQHTSTRESTATDGIVLYAVPTANSQRVAIALEELSLAYRVHIVNRAAGEQHEASFRAVNPAGMAPVIADPCGPDGPIEVAQSGAILIYLAEQTGRLLPDQGAARARVMQWLMHVMTDVNATGSTLYFARTKVATPDAATVALFEERMLAFMRDCDTALASGDYLAGEISIADIALYPLAAPRRALLEQGGLARLVRWMARMEERPSVMAGMRAVAPPAT